ncbi:MAG: class I SAM-dependent methyltransferase [Anaerolineae bacterium]|nr:class I SAM-dependent methyltransferase [Thermoflexales bacterium]MDW8408663.1 class I SAM-dependent methyltransferase [Anaerolineae bacterium]
MNEETLARAIEARAEWFDPQHETAVRLFAGFYEGNPQLVIDLYARTLVIHNYADPPEAGQTDVEQAQDFLLQRLGWVRAVVLKTRHASDPAQRRGRLIHGTKADTRIREGGVRYAINLLLNRDASFYLDTRTVRTWARQYLRGKTVLNAFAYTGSLGAAAMAGGAARVIHLDANRTFLNLAKETYTLNGFPIHKADFIADDFWAFTSRLRRAGQTFDCVFLDPPFFAAASTGTVDLLNHSERLINKVRPLVTDGGRLVVINNALFLSGRDYLGTLNELCADGYMTIEELISVPSDVTGYPHTTVGAPPVDPAPFNHPTKIVVLRVQRRSSSPLLLSLPAHQSR